MNIRNPFFYRTLLFLVFVEILSFFAYLYPAFNTVAFFVLVFIAFVATLTRLEYGVFLVLVELFIGSRGYLFFWDVGGAIVSIRIALWLVVMGVWAAQTLIAWARTGKPSFSLHRSFAQWYGALGIVLLAAVANGMWQGNSFSNVFFDFNGWLYVLLLFPFLTVLKSEENRQHVLTLLLASVLWTSLKALFLLWAYVHDPFQAVFPFLYRWVRTSGVGELTVLSPTFLRVFFQSQIFTLIAFFLLLHETSPSPSPIRRGNVHGQVSMVICQVLFFSSLLLSFSRSFWLGGVAALGVYLFFLIVRKISFKEFLKPIFTLIGVLGGSFLLIAAVVYLPLPRAIDQSFASLLETRATQTEESAVASRWNLLPPLWEKVKAHWFFGSGFGSTVTYESNDPRVVQSTAKGQHFYTTYAFEWGYLDLLLKLGFVGLLVYLGLIGSIGWKLYQKFLISNFQFPIVGLLCGFMALLVTNIFSPYLNHPLGIGYILLLTTFISPDLSSPPLPAGEGPPAGGG